MHFATDAWTSPNHRAFVAWMVHLHHEGHILTFLLDIIEVPKVCSILLLQYHLLIVVNQSHTGDALAQAFHKMLVEHGLTEKVSPTPTTSTVHSLPLEQILTFVGDNATSNDKQTTRLHRLPNLFESVNHIPCFNHTMQLSAKALLRPFACATSTAEVDSINEALDNDEMDEMPGLKGIEDDEEADNDNDNNDDAGGNGNDDDEIDEEFNGLSDEEREQLLDNTAAVRGTLDKVC